MRVIVYTGRFLLPMDRLRILWKSVLVTVLAISKGVTVTADNCTDPAMPQSFFNVTTVNS